MNHESKESDSKMRTGIVVGVAIGVAIGLLMNNLAVGIGIGVAIGVAIGSGLSQRKEEAQKLGAAAPTPSRRIKIGEIVDDIVPLPDGEYIPIGEPEPTPRTVPIEPGEPILDLVDPSDDEPHEFELIEPKPAPEPKLKPKPEPEETDTNDDEGSSDNSDLHLNEP